MKSKDSATNSYSMLGAKTNWRFRILGEENFLIIMSIEWKNKIKSIDFRHGLDRLYFVATLVWFVGWFIAFLF